MKRKDVIKRGRRRESNKWEVIFDPGPDEFQKGAILVALEQTIIDGNLNLGTILQRGGRYYKVSLGTREGEVQSLVESTREGEIIQDYAKPYKEKRAYHKKVR